MKESEIMNTKFRKLAAVAEKEGVRTEPPLSVTSYFTE